MGKLVHAWSTMVVLFLLLASMGIAFGQPLEQPLGNISTNSLGNNSTNVSLGNATIINVVNILSPMDFSTHDGDSLDIAPRSGESSLAGMSSEEGVSGLMALLGGLLGDGELSMLGSLLGGSSDAGMDDPGSVELRYESNVISGEEFCDGLLYCEDPYIEALNVSRGAVNARPDDPLAWFYLGRSLFAVDEVDAAIEAYNKSIELSLQANDTAAAFVQKNAQYMMMKDLLYLGRFDEAINAANQVIALDGLNVKAYAVKLYALNMEGRLNESLEVYDQVAAIMSQDANPLVGKGLILRRLDRQNESLQAFDNATKLDPTNYKAWMEKGFVLCYLGQINESIESFNQAILIDDGDWTAWYSKGVALAGAGRYDEAIDALDMAIEIDSFSDAALEMKDWIMRYKGTYDGSQESY